jgi:hypothetical protein
MTNEGKLHLRGNSYKTTADPPPAAKDDNKKAKDDNKDSEG